MCGVWYGYWLRGQCWCGVVWCDMRGDGGCGGVEVILGNIGIE